MIEIQKCKLQCDICGRIGTGNIIIPGAGLIEHGQLGTIDRVTCSDFQADLIWQPVANDPTKLACSDGCAGVDPLSRHLRRGRETVSGPVSGTETLKPPRSP